MGKHKFLALVMALVLVFSLTACKGGEETADPAPEIVYVTGTPTPAPTAAPTATPTPVVEDVREASVDFEDGVYDFMAVYLKHATSDEAVISIDEFNGSKALKVETTNDAKFPWIAIDVYSLLGDAAADVATVEYQIGTIGSDGKFYAVSGDQYVWLADDAKLSSAISGWSTFMANKNPKYASVDLASAGYVLSADSNVVIVSLAKDIARTPAEGGNGEPSTLYFDNFRFLDAAGNLLKPATTAVAFAAPNGFANTSEDRANLVNLAGVEFPGFATGAGAWAQAGFDMPEEILEALVPGSYIEVAFDSAAGVIWPVLPNAAAGWSRCGQGDDFSCPAIYFNDTRTVAQIPFEAIAAVCGDDVSAWGPQLQFESKEAWEVFSVKVGMPGAAKEWVTTVELPGFATSAGAWAQDGFALTEEQWAAFVPGSYIKASFSAENGVLWAVLPDAAAGWSRCADADYCGNGHSAAIIEGDKCYIPYEMVEEICGTDKSTWGARLQFESNGAWEVYDCVIGTYETQSAGEFVADVTLDGFATTAGAWAQDGFALTEEQWAAFVPGSYICASFSAENDVLWAVLPDAAAGWSRCGDADYCGNGHSAAILDGDKCYISYEIVEEICGTDKSTWGERLQFESNGAWEVYDVAIGHMDSVEVPRLRNIYEFPGFATSAGAWSQAGFDMTEEFIARLVPGSVVKIQFAAENDVLWVVMPDAAAGWMRCADADYCGNGHSAAILKDGVCYVTYEQIAEMCGDDVSTWGSRIQCESNGAWEVFSLSIGQR